MKKLKKLLTTRPSNSALVMIAGFIVSAVGYTWARLTYDQNIANNDPNAVAGILMIVGGATLIAGYGLRRYNRKPKKKKKSKKTKKSS